MTTTKRESKPAGILYRDELSGWDDLERIIAIAARSSGGGWIAAALTPKTHRLESETRSEGEP